jgi:hypothetical protein
LAAAEQRDEDHHPASNVGNDSTDGDADKTQFRQAEPAAAEGEGRHNVDDVNDDHRDRRREGIAPAAQAAGTHEHQRAERQRDRQQLQVLQRQHLSDAIESAEAHDVRPEHE